MSIKPILSVGIDVGTTSTHLTINRLFLSNVSRAAEPERVVISRREKLYESPVRITPLLEDGSIDADAILSFLDQEYTLANLHFSDITSGAILVTGETAKIRNAESVAKKISHLAGQFVVASAGPNFESVLAGRGSGAAEYSKTKHKVVCNVDIGGGTTNIALFKNGEVKSTAAIAIGGRLLCIDDEMKVLKCSDAGRIAVKNAGTAIQVGQITTGQIATKIAAYAASSIVDMITVDRHVHSLLITPPLIIDYEIDEYWFSGGVAEVMSAISSIRSDTEYGDLGVYLAGAMITELESRKIKFTIPEHPIRATVLGAGIHSLQLSGSTVEVSPDLLPLNDIPVVRIASGSFAESGQAPTLAEFIRLITTALSTMDITWSNTTLALSAPYIPRLGYQGLAAWARVLADAYIHFGAQGPFIVVCTADVGSALGLLLRGRLPEVSVVCIDGIEDDVSGDYLDIGRPLAGGRAVPVMLKNLIFGIPASWAPSVRS